MGNMPQLPPDGDLYHYVTVVGGFNTSVLTSDSVEVDSILFELESTNLHTVVHPLILGSAVNPNMMTVDATLIYNDISYPNYELESIYTFIIPVNVTFGGNTDDSSGDDSTDNIGGVAYQILTLMPILVILSLIAVVLKPYLFDRLGL